jgi:GT2 family glycosyltransferase
VLVPSAAYKKVGKISSDYSHARADYDYAERLKLANIPFYVTSKYVGTCPFDFDGKISGKSLAECISWLWKPGYFNLKDLYLIRSRYHGKLKAVISCLKLIQIVVTGAR